MHDRVLEDGFERDWPGPIIRNGSVSDIPDHELIHRALMSIRPTRTQPRIEGVMARFGLGSTYAYQLCRRFGFDPDAKKP